MLRTHNGMNLGAVARAMNNFGLSNLVLADLGAVDWSNVNRMAVRSKALTEQATRVDSLEAAIEGCSWVVGTSMRALAGQRQLPPAEVALELVTRSATQDVAIVFGEERIGLTNKDLLRCHDVSAIPTSSELPSLNLAQAALVYLWEIANAQGDLRAQRPTAAAADEKDYRAIEKALRAHMLAGGFHDPDRPRHGALDLIQTLKRAGLTKADARLWQAVLHSRPSSDSKQSGASAGAANHNQVICGLNL